MRIYKMIILGLIFALITSCTMPGTTPASPTVDPGEILTAAAATAYSYLTQTSVSVSPTPSETPTETPVPLPTQVVLPTSIPTIEPIPGVMRANANVRSIPLKSKEHDIGGLFFNQAVKVIGRNDAATWLLLIYQDSPTGTGWVTANAVTLSTELGILPVVLYPAGFEADSVMIPPYIFQITGTPLPPSTPPADWSKFGTLLQSAKVRIGPSIGFVSIGILNPGEKVTFRGRIAENEWVMIEYPSGPDGHGWILSSLVQANDGFGGLPYYDVMGTPVTPKPEGQEQAQPEVVPSVTPTIDSTLTPAMTLTSTIVTSVNETEGEVTNQINVRSGPAQVFQAYATLNPGGKVVITGVTLNGYWYKIIYPQSPDGFGWVASQYVRIINGAGKIPFYTNEGNPIP